MGPKKGKDVMDENYWRTSIENTPLDEDTWKVKVIVMEAAGSDQDRIYLNKFETFAAKEKRFVVKNICKTETTFMVNQLGGGKKVKDDNLRVFEEGQAFLKDKKDIPPDILALIVKHLILKMKEEYLFIKRQRLEVREGMRRESTTMFDRAEVRNTVNVKPPKPLEPPPAPKGKGKKSESETSPQLPEPDEGKKYNTLLRIRGEEWRDKVYVDDFPADGPNLYVAITGFVEPLLPECLIKIGVPLVAVIQIRINSTCVKVPSSLFRATKRGQSQTDILAQRSHMFWDDLQNLRIDKNFADSFKNTAFVVFSPPYWDTESLSGSPDKIYDELCYLMYDIQDLTRQHIHYLENMDVIGIPIELEHKHFMKYYYQQIEDLPLECVTVYSVLDSVLQTICNNQNLDEETSRSSLSTAITINQDRQSVTEENKLTKSEALVDKIFNTLCKTDTNKNSYRITYGDEYENHKDPIIINYGDYAKYNTFHLGNINLENIVWSMLVDMPINRLWRNQVQPCGENEAKINFHVNVLLSCFDRDDVETLELNRLLHILACRKLYNNRSSLKKHHLSPSTILEFKKVYLKRSVLAEPFPKCQSLIKTSSTASPSFPSMSKSENTSDVSYKDDPETQRIKFLFDCPDISELVSAAEIISEKPINHMIDEFDFFEDFSGINGFQIMLDAFNKFNCVDYKYCEVTDCFILMFFNSHDKEGISREEWRCHLPTPLCLQDFFDFVLEEHYDWIQNEEKIYDENIILKTQSVCKDLIDPFAAKSCVENSEIEMELLMEGSLKYQEIAQIEEPSPEATESKIMPSKKTTISPSSTDIDSKSSKKAKSPTITPKNVRQSMLVLAPGSDMSIELPKKPFSGYDLSDRRVEVFGKDAIYFSKDGTRISSMYTLVIPMNLEYIILNLKLGNENNEFWVHRALGNNVTADIRDTCESFRITTKDQGTIYIKKESYQIPIQATNFSSGNNLPLNKKESSSVKSNLFLPQIFERKTYHSLYVTWPNGLITQSVHDDGSHNISHIKQCNVNHVLNLNEDMRCISLNGEVVIFKTSGDIEVLRPDGSLIKITKYEKRKICSHLIEDAHSETSSDKNKNAKGKEKDKSKEKPGKASSKSSKSFPSEDDKIEVKPESRQVLYIEEFEIIETNGLRQKWISDNVFDVEKLLIRTATDFCLGEIFSRRMDGTNILLNKEGTHIVTFPDKTRIITNFIIENDEIYPEWTEDEKEYFFGLDIVETETFKSRISISQKSNIGAYSSIGSSMSRKFEEEETVEKERTDGYVSVQIIYSIEHLNFTTVTINKSDGKVIVDSPNDTSVIMDNDNIYEIKLDPVTSAKFDGKDLQIHYEACTECQANTQCKIRIRADEFESSVSKIHQNWLKMKDSFCKHIIVNEEGSIYLVDEIEEIHTEELIDNIEEKSTDIKSDNSVNSHGKCREMYQTKDVRFFVLHRDLTCSEVIHRALIDQYKRTCRWQPWCSINQHDTFGDHRSLHSLLTPVNLTETEKWLMDSKLADKPKYLAYKDLRKDVGKGFYHWMRPYERFKPKPMKPENVLPPRLPRAFVLRTLEQQWSEAEREELKGAKELLKAILRYRRIMESDSETILNVPILDLRPEDERRIDDIIQALAHRIYENLKMRLADDVQSRAKATITTKLPPAPEEMSVEMELEDEATEDVHIIIEKQRESLVQELDSVEKMSPNLRRYWRRRAEEYKEEQFYKYLLRDGSVPPYFRNVLGGAIWWEMNTTASEAVTKAERRKMKCVCATEEATTHTHDTDDIAPPFV